MAENLSAQEWLESRVRDAARRTAKRLRQTADDIERIANEDELDRVPGRVVNTLMWGLANAHPDDAATQYGEYTKAERAGHFNTEPSEVGPTTEQKD